MIAEILTTASDILSGRLGSIVLLAALFILVVLGKDWWLIRIQKKFIEKIKWTILEIKIPKENLKSPKSMEQVFMSLRAAYSFGLKWIDKWWGGKVEEWISFEMAGFAGGIHFYVYTPQKYRNLIEAAIFSQYPEAEIQEAEDYTTKFGSDLPDDSYDLFGTDYILAKDDYFPIKTYPFFEEREEEKRLDPIATIAEAMSGLKDDEMIWLQLLVRPTGDGWKDKAEELINKVMGRAKKAPPHGIIDSIMEFFGNLIWAPVQYPTWGKGGAEDKPAAPKQITPGERGVLEAVENKISQIGYESILRFLYLDKKNAFTGSNVSAVMGAIHQFSTLHLNSLRPNPGTITVPRAVGKFRRRKRLWKRKRKLFKSYLKREMPLRPRRPFSLFFKTSILCVEELATLYHPPITTVAAPSLKHLEAKKGSAPSNLPIITN